MKFPRLVHNLLSYLGLAVAVLAFLVFLFLIGLMVFAGASQTPYVGLVTFVLVPAVLLLGLALVPVGMAVEWLRWRRSGERRVPTFPVINLNNPRHRNATLVFLVGSAVVLLVATLASYEAYETTESVAFCGALCHTVMRPEYTTYQQSPHARVRCVECHVGPGAGWFVRSKISGIPQIFFTLTGTYPRPIPTPVANLRPAQETCEACHWPRAFFGGQQQRRIHFLPDEANTRWDINLLLKTGGGSPATSRTEGIHWHMNIESRLEYIATDEKLQNIKWVRITDLQTGKSTEYFTGTPLSREEIDRSGVHRMDCIDCHNRPTHIFRSPSYSVNLSLAAGKLDPTLPYLKRTAVALLAASYESEEAARQAIETGVRKFYTDKYPQLAKEKAQAIDTAVSEVQKIFGESEFPHMKVRWDTHPDNLGHLNSLGCDRCHDGGHKTASGVEISTTCRSCHLILSQGKPGQKEFASNPEGLDFRHPVDIGEAWKDTLCSECHTGGPQ